MISQLLRCEFMNTRFHVFLFFLQERKIHDLI